MKPHTLSTLLLVAGVALLVLGYFEPQISASFVEVVTDDTPPVWILDASGAPMLYPIDGAVYGTPVTNIRVGASDPESYITSVVATIDGTVYPLPFTGGLPGYGIYSYLLATPITSGQHSLSYVATNGVGLQTTYTGSFSFSTVIQGTWYVNGIEITSSIQTVYSSSLTVNFTFTRSSGPTTITCTVKEGGTSLLTLTSTDSLTWCGSFTFTGGAHTVALTASDGTTSVIMAVLSVNFGGLVLDFTNEQLAMFAVGACFLGAGGYLRLPKKKQ
jgi:hypothetical protein